MTKRIFGLAALVALLAVGAEIHKLPSTQELRNSVKDMSRYEIFNAADGKAPYLVERKPDMVTTQGEIRLQTKKPQPSNPQTADLIEDLVKVDVQVGTADGKPIFLEVLTPQAAASNFDGLLGTTDTNQWLPTTGNVRALKCPGPKVCVQTKRNASPPPKEYCIRWQCQ